MGNSACFHTIWSHGYVNITLERNALQVDVYHSTVETQGCEVLDREINDSDRKGFKEASVAGKLLVDGQDNLPTGNTIPDINSAQTASNPNAGAYIPFNFFWKSYCAEPCCYNATLVGSQTETYYFEGTNTQENRSKIRQNYKNTKFQGIANELGLVSIINVTLLGIGQNGVNIKGSDLQKAANQVINNCEQNTNCENAITYCQDCLSISIPSSDSGLPIGNSAINLMKQRYDSVQVLDSESIPDYKRIYLFEKNRLLNQQP